MWTVPRWPNHVPSTPAVWEGPRYSVSSPALGLAHLASISHPDGCVGGVLGSHPSEDRLCLKFRKELSVCQSGPMMECTSWWSREPTIPGSVQDREGLVEMCGRRIPASGGFGLDFPELPPALWF